MPIAVVDNALGKRHPRVEAAAADGGILARERGELVAAQRGGGDGLDQVGRVILRGIDAPVWLAYVPAPKSAENCWSASGMAPTAPHRPAAASVWSQ